MLRLHKMQMAGFKSFGDRTEVVFPEGITAVVGPNGCGKSNIGDAINWVLGEQSAKMLRGASMDDVIFNGSEKRKPLGMAEVSLHLSGENGDAERRDVVLTRRLFRDGESEYLINGARSRLKDIQEVLRDAHVGAKTYATIEQGRIDQILNAKPKDRRMLIEDAAGVSGFKQKRRLTELKLDATQANLLRVNDILGEVRRQINALKRQAAKARRYQRLRDQLRRAESVRFGVRAGVVDADLAAARNAEAAARDAEAQSGAELASLEAEVAAERQALDELGLVLQEDREALHRLRLALNDEEACARQCRERIEAGQTAEARLEQEIAAAAARQEALAAAVGAHAERHAILRRELDSISARASERQEALAAADAALAAARAQAETLRRSLFESLGGCADQRNRHHALEEALERNRAARERRLAEQDAARLDLARLEAAASQRVADVDAHRGEVLTLEQEHADSEAALAAARERLAVAHEALVQAREAEAGIATRLHTLEDVATRFAAVSDGVRVLLSPGAAPDVRVDGVVADYVEAPQAIEAAAEAYLQGLLPAVVLEDDAAATAAAGLLRAHGSGRTVFVCKTQPVGAPAVGAAPLGGRPLPDGFATDRRIRGRLSEHLRVKNANGFLKDRLGDALLVDCLESALALHREHPYADYIAPSGEVVYASGLIAAGGAHQAEHGLLAHTRKIHTARAEQAAARATVAERQEAAVTARDTAARLEAQLADRRHRLEAARRQLVSLTLEAERSSEETRRTGRTAEVLAEEVGVLAEEARDLDEALRGSRQALTAAEARHAASEAELADTTRVLDAMESRRQAIAEEVSGLRVAAAGHGESLVAQQRDGERLRGELGDVTARIEAARAERGTWGDRVNEARALLASTEADRIRHLAEHEAGAARLARVETDLDERRRGLAERESGLRERRQSLDGLREALRRAEVRRTGAESDRRHLDDLCLQELGMTAADAAAAAGDGLAGADPEAVETEIAALRTRIESIGPVNMMAIDEFTELEERHRFLDAQRLDLEQSMASLRDTIRRINSTSRERFLEAFESIRASYQEIFKLLFGGGRADLRLEEGEDVLESGIEILAQPPGKRLGSVQLMSGGEKAMSAIALLFAIFRYQPSPFCLLDEVDAALDDLNVNRFTRMLREYAGGTQFILITHNKLSMDSANLLYGVTMEEPGVSRLVSLKLD